MVRRQATALGEQWTWCCLVWWLGLLFLVLDRKPIWLGRLFLVLDRKQIWLGQHHLGNPNLGIWTRRPVVGIHQLERGCSQGVRRRWQGKREVFGEELGCKVGHVANRVSHGLQ